MKRLEMLYRQLQEVEDDKFYRLVPEFCAELYYHIPAEGRPLCATAFLTVENCFAVSVRSGVWTFYEAVSPADIEATARFLEQTGQAELLAVFRRGAHDYQDPKYDGNWDYPEEWLEEAEELDCWIAANREWLYQWEREVLTANRELLCSLAE